MPDYLLQTTTGRTYPWTAALAGRKDMVPCNEAGELNLKAANVGGGPRPVEIPERAEGVPLLDFLKGLTNRQIAEYMLAKYEVVIEAGKKDDMIAKALEAVGEA
ncbi:MAG: hypothetical protein AAGU21_01040 [Solidesulfovibrio sp.]|uniref:hypothetical protein n=1 Tax=Solidesulfovibrio sp. TaxID=2910990 RepID=UPI002B21023D|nr:hypothetical protein [Solidesulfovibrio sp.]MEA4857905.1 hypothetical protein [Solidesulfovibrio sp.]